MLETTRAALRGEPVLVQVLVLIVIASAAHFGLPLSETGQAAVTLLAIAVSGPITRAFTTPAKPNPPAAGKPAEPQGAQTMDIKEAVANVEAKAKELWAALPPEFQHPAVDALHAAVDDAVNAAALVAEQQTTPDIGAAIDALKAKVQADADARIAQLESVKAVVAQ